MEEDDLDNFEDAREGSIDDFVFGKPGELTSESTGIASGDASDEAFKMLEREASVRMAASAEAPPVVSAVSAEPASAPASGAGMVSGADAVAEEGEEREAGEESSQWPDLVLGDGRVVPRRKKSVDAGDDMPEEKRNVDLANACKEEGNRHFASGTFDTAAACYTEALRHIPRDSSHDTARAVYYCNRAACSLALGKHEDALYDCDRTIELNPKYVKAYARRAAVFEKFEKLDEALTGAWLQVLSRLMLFLVVRRTG